MRRALIMLSALCVPAIAGAQGAARQGGDVIGTWKIRVVSNTRGKPALQAMAAKIDQVLNVLRSEPFLAQPRGFTVLANVDVHQSAPNKMVAGAVEAFLIRHETNDDGTIDTSGRGEGEGFGLTMNNIGCMFGEKTDWSDADGSFYSAVTPTTMHGLPMYGDNSCIVITKRTAPPTVPVTRERAMRAMIHQLDGTPAISTELQRELAQMSPSDRAAPAIVNMQAYTNAIVDGKVSGALFANGDGPTAVRLVAANPAFYDRTRLNDVQVLIIAFDCGGTRESPWCAQYPGVFDKIRDGLDWSALAALVR